MRPTRHLINVCLLTGMLASTASAQKQGDWVLTIKPTKLMSEKTVVELLPELTLFKVKRVDGEWLSVDSESGKTGWVKKDKVVVSTNDKLKQKYGGLRSKLNRGERSEVVQARAGFDRMDQYARVTQDPLVVSVQHVIALYRALCDFHLGHRSRAKKDMQSLITSHSTHRDLYLLHGELGKIYQVEWQAKDAERHLTTALKLGETELNKALKKSSELRMSLHERNRQLAKRGFAKVNSRIRTLQGDLLKFQLSRAVNDVILGENTAARGEFNALLNEIANAQGPEIRSIRTLCKSQLTELEYRDTNISSAIVQLRECVDELKASQIPTRHTIGREFFCRLAIARYYRELTRFSDAEDELKAAETLLSKTFGEKRILGSLRVERHQEELENARANLLLEWARSDFEKSGPSQQLDRKIAESINAIKASESAHNQITKDMTKEVAVRMSVEAALSMLRGRMADSEANRRQANEESLKSYDKSIGLFVDLLDDPNLDVVLELRRDRAAINQQLGNTAAALKEANLLLGAYRLRYGINAIQVASIHQLLISIYEQQSDLQAAREHVNQHRSIINTHSLSYLASLTPAAQQRYSRRWNEPGLHAGLRLASANGDDQELVNHSVEWLMNGKAKSAELLASANLKAQGPRNLQQLREIRKIVEQQSYLAYGLEQDFQPNKLLELESKRRQVVEDRRISNQSGLKGELPYTLPHLQSALQPDEVFIDILAVNDTSGRQRDYFAWIVTSNQPVRIVRLGGAKQVSADVVDQGVGNLIRQFRTSKHTPKLSKRYGYAQAEQDLRDNFLRVLSLQVFRPLWDAVQHMGQQNRWIISPDGELWNLPWAAMLVPTDDGDEYAVKTLTIQTIVSARDLLQRKSPAAAPVQLVTAAVITNPGLDSQDTQGGKPRPASEQLPPLGAEGLKVDKLLRNSGFKVQTYKDTTADKVAIEEIASKPPQILYLSTHGRFLQKPVDDPFLACCIALSGYNVLPSNNGRRLPGVLTGAEVLLTNLKGTELVVLSACQTGHGQTSYGHSAASLRHAFHLAGAQGVVSTQWSVLNTATEVAMLRFMENLVAPPDGKAPMRKADALRDAQIWMIDGLRAGKFNPKNVLAKGHAHPYLWAAFSLSGF